MTTPMRGVTTITTSDREGRAMKLSIFAAAAAALAVPAWSLAQDAAGIEAAAWLAGRWVGEGLGGQVEETWAPAVDGRMVGHFQLVRDGAVAFYELMLIDEVEGGLRLRVKHFEPDFVGWEEKDGWHAFEPKGATEDALAFNGLTLRRTGEDTAEFVVQLQYEDGVRDEVLRVTRAPL
jgi:hypothetical protein